MWLNAKQNGMEGVPSASELVRDAEYIDHFLDKVESSFHGLEKTLSAKNQKLLSLPVDRKELSR